MGEEEEDRSSVSKESSKGSISRAGPSSHTPKSQSNESSSQRGPRRTRPGRAQRQRGREAAENSAPTAGRLNLNPSAPDFVPRPVSTQMARADYSAANANGNRPRGGRRGRTGKGKEVSTASTVAEEPSHEPAVGPSHRTLRNDNIKFQVQPKIIKESEDLMLRMTEALSKGEYDCSICTDSVSPFGRVTCLQKVQRWKPIWSCKVCWTVFHKSCIKKWASHSLGEGPVWRCPGCQTPSDTVPNEYRCWCGKVENPDVDRLATPHSCIQPCLRKRKSGCACVLPCHPGPCPPCYQVHHPPESCFCGKDSRMVKCVDYDPDSRGWSCGKPCSTPLDCNAIEVALSDGKTQRHMCEMLCHHGPCPPCQIQETVSCYCGKHTKEIHCSDKELPKVSQRADGDESNSWLGFYQCQDVCGRKFDCGIHSCEKRCHSQDLQTISCPKSPENVKFCACGKTFVHDLAERKTCKDPIPVCKKACEKMLSCGHQCQSSCHLGECPPCKVTISAKCRCGRSSFKLQCFEAGQKELLCERTCTSMKSCGRHHCGAQCCSGDHLCTKICGRPLKCGSHGCTVLCHRGPCPTCLEASFEPLICTCGRTEVVPPIRCGTKPLECPHPCIIEPACGHPKVAHGCHPAEEECPKCPYLVEKVCMCGKRSVRNQPCFRAQAGSVSCGMACGALMPCGFHRCPASCHHHTADGLKCIEKCGKPRKSCGHACQLKCHSPSACGESVPCQARIIVRCDCGLHKQEIACLATSTEQSHGLKNLPCTDLCARTERNRKLAEALDIDTTASFHEPENVKGGYQLRTLEYFNNNKLWCLEIEEMFREFLIGKAMRLAFKPMTGHKREFVHELADTYGLDSESVDHEPFRSVEIYRNNRAAIPRHTLSEAAKLKTPHSLSAATYASSGLVQLRKHIPGVAYNAIFLEGIKGTVLQVDLQTALNPILRPCKLVFSVKWINDGKDVLLCPGATTMPIEEVESALHSVMKPVKQYISTSGVAIGAELCWINREGQVSYRESTKQQQKKPNESTSAAPWSKFMAPKFESSNTYDALSGVGTSAGSSAMNRVVAKKKKESTPVLDDWESFEG